jgi:ribonuclease E
MTEEAPDPQAGSAEEGSTESRPRTRHRRRGSRGRGRGSGTARTKPSGEADSSADGGGAAGTAEKEAAGSTGEPKKKSQAGGRSRARSRRRTSKPKAAEDGAGKERAAEAAEVAEGGEGEMTSSPTPSPDGGSERPASRSRRRRRRRKPAGAGTAQAAAAPEAPPAAAQARAPSKPDKAPAKREKREERGRGGPTRTSRAARQSGSDRRRRRPQVHAPRSTDKIMLMTEHHDRLQIAVVEDRELVEHYVTRTGARSMVGNIYLGRVQNVLPGMEAAFVDVGRGRNAVLYAGEVSYDEDVERGDRRIEQALKAGQSVIVQVTKDPLRGKGARLTAQISLPGRYLVYVPDGGASGISRRVADAERERLRKILKKVRPSEAGVIVRTAAEGASEEDLAADLDRLKKIWEQVRRRARRARAPNTLYEEPDLEERVVRDVFSPAEFKEIVTDSREVYERVSAYLRDVAPELVDRLRLHEGPLPLFEEFHVAEQIHKALERKVWLPSGGYLFIDRVEAMTVIDVNTGKHVGKTNLEETVFGTNVEAAQEIARQLRLRDIGGIIVIDFIDMLFERNRAEVIRTLQEALSRDKTRSQVFDITPLGLLEVTRKKVSAGLLEAFSEPCPTCEGRGILLTHDVT